MTGNKTQEQIVFENVCAALVRIDTVRKNMEDGRISDESRDDLRQTREHQSNMAFCVANLAAELGVISERQKIGCHLNILALTQDGITLTVVKERLLFYFPNIAKEAAKPAAPSQ